MSPELVEIVGYDGPGYKAIVYFEGWRVAFLNDAPTRFRKETMPYMERHNATDEVFVLMEGQCTLYIGDGGAEGPGNITKLEMEKGKMFNIKAGVWHNLTGNEEMKLLIVENSDTSKQNSDFFPVTPDMLP